MHLNIGVKLHMERCVYFGLSELVIFWSFSCCITTHMRCQSNHVNLSWCDDYGTFFLVGWVISISEMYLYRMRVSMIITMRLWTMGNHVCILTLVINMDSHMQSLISCRLVAPWGYAIT